MRLIPTLILIVISFTAFGQQRVDLTYFTLGLVDDYLGRHLVKEDKKDINKIDYYHETEIDIMNYLDSLIKVENTFRERNNKIDHKRERREERNCTNCNEFFGYYSKTLAEEINDRYTFKFAKSWDEKNRKIYYGRLKKSAIKTDNQRVSFLLGAYLKFGNKDGEIYEYHQANSPSKYKALIKTLKNLNCKVERTNVTQNSIPTSQTIEFIPTKELKANLDTLESLKMKVESKRANFFDKQVTK